MADKAILSLIMEEEDEEEEEMELLTYALEKRPCLSQEKVVGAPSD